MVDAADHRVDDVLDVGVWLVIEFTHVQNFGDVMHKLIKFHVLDEEKVWQREHPH
jgi:hypothetical protein